MKHAVDAARIAKLERELGKLTRAVEGLRHATIVVPIATFAPEPFDLVRPISAVLAPCQGGFLASFLDANISTSGETRGGPLKT